MKTSQQLCSQHKKASSMRTRLKKVWMTQLEKNKSNPNSPFLAFKATD